MGTRSTIALEFADGTVEQVYCHWDGYLSHNGKILAEHYSDPFKLRDLIDLGGISSLAKEIGSKHNFNDMVEGETKFYTRDRGEELTVEKFPNFGNYAAFHQREEFAYCLRNVDGKAVWFVADDDGPFVELAKLLVKEAA